MNTMAAFVLGSYLQSDASSSRHPSGSRFNTPGFFLGFNTNSSADSGSDSSGSPKSPHNLFFSSFKNPFGFRCQKPSSRAGSKPILHNSTEVGLGIVNSLASREVVDAPKTRNILFRPQVKKTDSSNDVGEPSTDFLSTVVMSFPGSSHVNNSLVTNPSSLNSTALSAREIELSEDYTCVICHGPNPKKTHIFCDCVLGCERHDGIALPQAELLSFCYPCKNNNIEGQDISSIYSSESSSGEDLLFEGL